LANAKAMILWSHQENFGISVAESLSVGVPVLLSKQVNIWSEIVENNAGIAGSDTEDSLVDTIHTFCALSNNEYDEMCMFAKKTYEALYSPENYAERIKTLLVN
jgi:glycosyltransferase involved in cell wall biosynthesis